MVRPKKIDRGSLAITHIRISSESKQRLQALKQQHGFATIDQVLLHYLPSNAATAGRTLTAREIFDFTKQNPEANRLIKRVSNQIVHKLNKSELNQSKVKPVHNKTSWRKQKRRNW